MSSLAPSFVVVSEVAPFQGRPAGCTGGKAHWPRLHPSKRMHYLLIKAQSCFVSSTCSPISLCHGHRGAHRTDWSRLVSTPVLPPLVFGALFRVPSCEQPFPRPSGWQGLSLQLASSPGLNLLPPCIFLRVVREEGCAYLLIL